MRPGSSLRGILGVIVRGWLDEAISVPLLEFDKVLPERLYISARFLPGGSLEGVDLLEEGIPAGGLVGVLGRHRSSHRRSGVRILGGANPARTATV